jgi:hypothetical protein
MEETPLNDNAIISYNEIHMYKQARGRNTDSVIVGLIFKSKDNVKTFVSSIKKKFGINGCQKMMEDMDKDNPVFVFTGDFRDKITKILINEYNCDPKVIKKFG